MGVFDSIALVYDDAIDWNSRLEREMPFIMETLGEPEGKHVLDLACGTGRHSVELASRGASVIGIDISEIMLGRAKALAKARGVQSQFIQADIMELDTLTSGRFDLILCLGNSLSLLGRFEDQKTLLSRIHEHLTKDGVFVAQVLNFEEIRNSMFRFFPLKTGISEDRNNVVFLRFFDHRPDSTSDLFFVTFMFVENSWQSQSSIQPVLNMNEERLRALLSDAGFSRIEMFAGYNNAAFLPSESRSILVRACK